MASLESGMVTLGYVLRTGVEHRMASGHLCADHRDLGNTVSWETPDRSVRRFYGTFKGAGRQMRVARPVSRPGEGSTASADFTKCQFHPDPLSSQGFPPSSERVRDRTHACATHQNPRKLLTVKMRK